MGQTIDYCPTHAALVKALEDEIRSLEPHEQLQLASQLLVGKRPLLALAVARKVVDDMELLRLQGKL
jgi:hypothetical protein